MERQTKKNKFHETTHNVISMPNLPLRSYGSIMELFHPWKESWTMQIHHVQTEMQTRGERLSHYTAR